jgi:hypothetical protein
MLSNDARVRNNKGEVVFVSQHHTPRGMKRTGNKAVCFFNLDTG